LISNFRLVINIICFLLGNFPASEFYMPTFRNTLFVPSSQAGRYLPTYEDGTDRVFRNVGIENSGAGELPRRKHTTKVLLFFFFTRGAENNKFCEGFVNLI